MSTTASVDRRPTGHRILQAQIQRRPCGIRCYAPAQRPRYACCRKGRKRFRTCPT